VKGNNDTAENNVPSYRLLRNIMFASCTLSAIRDRAIDLRKKIDYSVSLLETENEDKPPMDPLGALENYSIEDLLLETTRRFDKKKELQLNYEEIKNSAPKNSSPIKSIKYGDNIIAIAPYDIGKYSNDDLYNTANFNNYCNSPKVESNKKITTDNLEVPPSPLISDNVFIISNKGDESDISNLPFEPLTPGKSSFRKVPLSASDKDNKNSHKDYISPSKSPGRKMTWDCHE